MQTTAQHFGVSIISSMFLKEMNTLVQQGSIILIKSNVASDCKTISNKSCFFFTFYSSKNPEENASCFPQKY